MNVIYKFSFVFILVSTLVDIKLPFPFQFGLGTNSKNYVHFTQIEVFLKPLFNNPFLIYITPGTCALLLWFFLLFCISQITLLLPNIPQCLLQNINCLLSQEGLFPLCMSCLLLVSILSLFSSGQQQAGRVMAFLYWTKINHLGC